MPHDLHCVRRQIEHLPIQAPRLDPENARIHKPAQIRQIARSIEAFGFNAPILIDKDDKVIAGHGRLLALRLLGATEVPVIRLEHLSPAQARAYAIADNRLTENAQWHERQLALHLKELAALDLDFSIEATGFTIGEIDLKIEGLDDPPAADDADDAPAPAGPPVSTPGDLWCLGRHRVLCGSALDTPAYDRLLAGSLAAMVFSDPPYGVAIDGNVSNLMGGKDRRRHREFACGDSAMSEAELIAFLTKACGLMASFSAQASLHYLFMGWYNVFALLVAGRVAYDDLINICVWAKPSGGMGGLYRSRHELVLVFKHGRSPHRNNVKLGKYGRNRTNLWTYPGFAGMRSGEDADLTAEHPTPKPVRLVADAILDASARGDVVLDPFLGSGTTLIACERVGRVCAAIELDPLYVDLAIRRWQRLTGDDAILDATGATFDDIAARGEGGS